MVYFPVISLRTVGIGFGFGFGFGFVAEAEADVVELEIAARAALSSAKGSAVVVVVADRATGDSVRRRPLPTERAGPSEAALVMSQRTWVVLGMVGSVAVRRARSF